MYYKETLLSWIGAIIIVFLIIAGIVSLVFINAKKEHIPKPEEVYTKACAQRGGNAKTRTGYDNGIYVQEFSCEGAK